MNHGNFKQYDVPLNYQSDDDTNTVTSTPYSSATPPLLAHNSEPRYSSRYASTSSLYLQQQPIPLQWLRARQVASQTEDEPRVTVLPVTIGVQTDLVTSSELDNLITKVDHLQEDLTQIKSQMTKTSGQFNAIKIKLDKIGSVAKSQVRFSPLATERTPLPNAECSPNTAQANSRFSVDLDFERCCCQ